MGEKTTIEIDKIRELKQHALDTNKTLKQLINEAIDEKIQRERNQLGLTATKQNSQPRPVDSSVLEKTKGGISALEKILANAGLLTIVEKECSRHNLILKDLNPGVITQELIDDIHTAIKLVFDDDTADQIIHRIEEIFKNL
jgi:hypothetical protein